MPDHAAVEDLRRRAQDGERLSPDAARAFLEPDRLFDLLRAGRDLRRRRFGREATVLAADHPDGFAGSCPFCEFAEAAPGATPATLAPRPGRAFHAAAGLRGDPLALADTIRALRGAADGADVQGVTLAGIAEAARASGLPLASALAGLRDAGWTRVRGGAPVRGLDDPAWAWHRAAHEAGIETEIALAYDGSRLEALIAAIERLRRDVTEGSARFVAVVPMPSAPDSTGFADLRAAAVARVLLDGLVRIGVPFAALTEKLAPAALACGGDFLAVFAVPRPAPSPSAPPDPTAPGVPVAEIRRLLEEADLELRLEGPGAGPAAG